MASGVRFRKCPTRCNTSAQVFILAELKSRARFFGRVWGGDVFTTAKLRLPEFIKAKHKAVDRPILGTFGEARVKYEVEIAADHILKDAANFTGSTASRLFCGLGQALTNCGLTKLLKRTAVDGRRGSVNSTTLSFPRAEKPALMRRDLEIPQEMAVAGLCQI